MAQPACEHAYLSSLTVRRRGVGRSHLFSLVKSHYYRDEFFLPRLKTMLKPPQFTCYRSTATSRLWCLCVVALILTVTGNTLYAAGCSYWPHGLSTNTFAGSATTSKIVRIYEGGKFRYYLPNEGRCDGPNCGSGTPSMASESSGTTSRIDQAGIEPAGVHLLTPSRRPWECCLSTMLPAPVLDGILRPPSS